MKIAFVYSDNNSNYEDVVERIIGGLKNRLNQEVEYTKIISNITRKKYDLYVVISDDIEDFKFNLAKIKQKPLLITNNLQTDFIEIVLSDVVDIVYFKNKIEIIVNRLIGNVERLNESKK